MVFDCRILSGIRDDSSWPRPNSRRPIIPNAPGRLSYCMPPRGLPYSGGRFNPSWILQHLTRYTFSGMITQEYNAPCCNTLHQINYHVNTAERDCPWVKHRNTACCNNGWHTIIDLRSSKPPFVPLVTPCINHRITTIIPINGLVRIVDGGPYGVIRLPVIIQKSSNNHDGAKHYCLSEQMFKHWQSFHFPTFIFMKTD